METYFRLSLLIQFKPFKSRPTIQKSKSHIKILGDIKVTRNKFHTEGPQILGATKI
jgi:hypothetical protein